MKDLTSKVTSLRLPKDLATELEVVAHADDVPTSEAVRAAIYRYIDFRRSDNVSGAPEKAPEGNVVPQRPEPAG